MPESKLTIWSQAPYRILARDYVDALGCEVGEHLFIADNNWLVVVAQRPIPHIWFVDGEPVSGIGWESRRPDAPVLTGFFAAGDPDGEFMSGKTLGQVWRELDAHPVVLVSETEILDAIIAYCNEHEYDYAEFREAYPKLQAAARAVGMWYREVPVRNGEVR